MSEDPAGSRDLLKKLYQQLFPKSVRHDLGEYYTPDWLAEHLLNLVADLIVPISSLPIRPLEHQVARDIILEAGGSGNFLILAARPCSGNRTVGCFATANLHEHLGRRSDD